MIDDAMNYLQASVGKGATFRTWVGATGGTEEENQAAAEARCHLTTVATDDDTDWPFAVISGGLSFQAERIAGGAHDYYEKSGALELWFENLQANVAGATAALKMAGFLVTVMAVVDEILDLSGGAGYLSITRLATEQRPGFGEDDKKRPTLTVSFAVEWG